MPERKEPLKSVESMSSKALCRRQQLSCHIFEVFFLTNCCYKKWSGLEREQRFAFQVLFSEVVRRKINGAFFPSSIFVQRRILQMFLTCCERKKLLSRNKRHRKLEYIFTSLSLLIDLVKSFLCLALVSITRIANVQRDAILVQGILFKYSLSSQASKN